MSSSVITSEGFLPATAPYHMTQLALSIRKFLNEHDI